VTGQKKAKKAQWQRQRLKQNVAGNPFIEAILHQSREMLFVEKIFG
jgi:hypothetical protein